MPVAIDIRCISDHSCTHLRTLHPPITKLGESPVFQARECLLVALPSEVDISYQMLMNTLHSFHPTLCMIANTRGGSEDAERKTVVYDSDEQSLLA